MSRLKSLLDSQPQPAATIMRIALGAIILPHGAQHLLGWFGGYGFNGTLEWMVSVGFPAPLAAIAIITEFFAPLALILGVATRLAALGVAGIMAGAILTHIPNGFFMNWFGSLPAGAEGFEYHLLVLFMSIALIIQGSGAIAIDRWLVDRKPNRGMITKLGLFSLMLLLAACSDDEVSGPIGGGPQPVVTVNVQPDTMTLIVGETRQLQATVRTANGDVVQDRPVVWTVDDQSIATVNGNGVVTAHRSGTVLVRAASAGKTGSATLRVILPAPVIARVEVSPADVVLNVGESRQLGVRVFAADDTELPAPPAAQVQWHSVNPGAVSVNGNGVVTAQSGGEVHIRATVGNVTGTARVVVPSFLTYQMNNPIIVREYELITNTPNIRTFRKVRLVSSEFKISTDDRAYQQRFTLETWETNMFPNGSTISELLETWVREDFGAASQIVGVGDFVFHSGQNGQIFQGRRGGTSLEIRQDVPGAIEKIDLVFQRN